MAIRRQDDPAWSMVFEGRGAFECKTEAHFTFGMSVFGARPRNVDHVDGLIHVPSVAFDTRPNMRLGVACRRQPSVPGLDAKRLHLSEYLGPACLSSDS